MVWIPQKAKIKFWLLDDFEPDCVALKEIKCQRCLSERDMGKYSTRPMNMV